MTGGRTFDVRRETFNRQWWHGVNSPGGTSRAESFYMAMLSLLVVLVVVPALVGLLIGCGYLQFGRHHLLGKFRPGAPIVYRVLETSTCPSRDAVEVHPAEHGDLYYYVTNNYWRVEQVLPDGRIVARTPLMEHHYLRRDDPNLRQAGFIERRRYAARFPQPA